jgi:hypothetical protein
LDFSSTFLKNQLEIQNLNEKGFLKRLFFLKKEFFLVFRWWRRRDGRRTTTGKLIGEDEHRPVFLRN